MNKYIAILIGVFLFEVSIVATPFKSPESLINVPIGKMYNTGDLDFSIATGVNSIQSYQFDLSLNYAINEYFKGGITMINYQKAVLNVQSLLINSDQFGEFKLTGGILNISSDPSLSSWDDEKSVNSNNLIHFIVGSRNLLFGRAHFGVAKRRHSGMASIINGILFGYNKEIKKLLFMAEFDGSTVNFGIQRINPYKTMIVKMAFSAPVLSPGETDTTNLLSIQFTRRTNIFKRYSDSLKNLEEEYSNFQTLEEDFQNMKIELEQEINDLKKSKELLAKEVEKLHSRELGDSNLGADYEVSEEEKFVQGYSNDIQSLMYYQEAEKLFKNEEYYKAIQQLELAIELSPKEQRFYFVLGSIYYKLKNKKKAFKSWAEAYKIDPTSNDYNKLPNVIKNEILKEIKRKEIRKKSG
ncbi:hypothetical protein CL647_00460 [bacterium]|nr:hypothetical protein [bacterium]|tara:strand:- start:702 stop:1934 length:1233 start_codon:yes stop_codon:yes gene_type:complete